MNIHTRRLFCNFTGRKTMDYGYTLQFAFEFGPEKLRYFSKYAKRFVNVTIGTMQMGFCMVFLVFIGTLTMTTGKRPLKFSLKSL